jgi:hypothetical protein
MDLKVGDKFAFASEGLVYTVIRCKGSIAWIEAPNGFRGKLNLEAFDETPETRSIAPTP